MGDLVRASNMINDWDLEAIIRGGWCGAGGSSCNMAVDEVAMTWQPPRYEFELGFESVDQLEATATVLNELEELYKPFLLQHQQPTIITTSSSLSSPTIFYPRDDGVDKPDDQRLAVVDAPTTEPSKPRYLRGRKRKQKTRVVQLSLGDEDEENVRNMDEWNWRKYGQKSIKGSPYPRSYYRCSTLKGCEARKQVEQSIEHPYTFIATYIGEHAHPFPIRRRSLPARKLTYFSETLTATSNNSFVSIE